MLLQERFACLPWGHPNQQTRQAETGRTYRTGGSHQPKNQSREGFVGLGGVVLGDTALQARSKEAHQIHRNGPHAFIRVRFKVSLLLDGLLPVGDEISDVEASIGEGGTGTAYGS